MARQLLWPDRVRCRACRRYLGWTVVDLLFCSWGCAGRPDPREGREPAEAPRCCRSMHRDKKTRKVIGWRWKVRYRTEDEVLGRSDLGQSTMDNRYVCPFCGFWHVATGPPRLKEKESDEDA